jgi:ComF family protein
MLARALKRLVQFLLPARCAGCQRLGPDVLCTECAALLEPVGANYCVRCGRRRATDFASPDCAECHGESLGVVRARSLYVYSGVGREILAQYKFNGYIGAGQVLARHLVDWTAADWPQLYDEPDTAFDLVTPVPLHPARLRRRRFNQALLPARKLARAGELVCAPQVLERQRETPTQVGLSASQRRLNVRGAFSVPEQQRQLLQGKRVLLVDDLMTTGATLASCARTLRRGGALSVHGLTLFSTVHEVETPNNW